MYKEIILVIALLIGVAGTLLPLLPGIPLMFLAILIYGFIDNWQNITPLYAVSIGFIAIFSVLVDYFSGIWGAKKYGATKQGTWGGVIGGILGIFILGPLGLFIGPFIGVILGELLTGKKLEASLRAATGSLIGVIGGSLIRFLIAIVVLIWTVIKIFL